MKRMRSAQACWTAYGSLAIVLIFCSVVWAAVTWTAGDPINEPVIVTPTDGEYYGLGTLVDLTCNDPSDWDHWEDGEQCGGGESQDESVTAKWSDGEAGGYFPDTYEGTAVTYVTPATAGSVTLYVTFDDEYTAMADDYDGSANVQVNVANAKMVFKVNGVEATEITRGQTGSFEVVDGNGNEIAGATYANWSFSGDDPDVWAVENGHTNRTWSGTVVASGFARCVVTIGGNPANVSSKKITVNARQGAPWAMAALVAIPAGDEDADANWGAYPNHGAAPHLLGQNQDKLTAPRTEVIQPGPLVGWVNGYTRAEIDGGPNNDLWYVTNTSLYVQRRSVVNRFCKPNQQNLPDPPNVGWFEYNIGAYQDQNYLDGLVVGIKAHENMGQGANPKGHQRQLIAEYGVAGNDPREAIEPLAARNENDLKGLATAAIQKIEDRLMAKMDAPEPSGNWGPKWVMVHTLQAGWNPTACAP